MRNFPQIVTFKAPQELLPQIAAEAERRGMSASAFIRQAIVREMKRYARAGRHEMAAYDGPRGLMVA